jgi:hypothetical protein
MQLSKMYLLLVHMVLLAACLAHRGVQAQDGGDVASIVPEFILPWDIPVSEGIPAVVGPKCTEYDFDAIHTIDEVQVYIVQAEVSAF